MLPFSTIDVPVFDVTILPRFYLLSCFKPGFIGNGHRNWRACLFPVGDVYFEYDNFVVRKRGFRKSTSYTTTQGLATTSFTDKKPHLVKVKWYSKVRNFQKWTLTMWQTILVAKTMIFQKTFNFEFRNSRELNFWNTLIRNPRPSRNFSYSNFSPFEMHSF